MGANVIQFVKCDSKPPTHVIGFACSCVLWLWLWACVSASPDGGWLFCWPTISMFYFGGFLKLYVHVVLVLRIEFLVVEYILGYMYIHVHVCAPTIQLMHTHSLYSYMHWHSNAYTHPGERARVFTR